MQTYQERTLAVRAGLLAPTLAVAILLATLLAALLTACGTTSETNRENQEGQVTKYSLKSEVLSTIEAHYFEEPKIDTSHEVEDIVRRLDPFSKYFHRSEYEAFMSDMQDEDFAYGFNIRVVGGKIIVTTVEPESPAAEAGLLPGDEIVSISKMLVYGNRDRFDRLVRQSTKKCEFGIRRASERKPIRVWMERGKCVESSVPVAMMLDSTTGYIKIEGFHEGTANRVLAALDQLSRCGAKAMVLDLRGNCGGFVNEALQSANLFAQSDTPVLEIHSRVSQENKRFELQAEAKYARVPLVLLVDGYSASATEIFAGILQDLSRATIIGQPTRGKALVMQMFPLQNQDHLFLATSAYYLPSGRCVQRPYAHDTIEANYSELETQDNFDHKLDSQMLTDDCVPYLRSTAASVYGGQGIMPDVIVGTNDYHQWLRTSIYTAMVPYLHQNAHWLLEQSLFSFDKNWSVPDSLTEVALADSRAKDTSQFKQITANIAWETPQFVKWYIAYCVWGDKGTFAAHTRHSTIVKRALEVLRGHSIVASKVASIE